MFRARLRDAASARREIERLEAMRDELTKMQDGYWAEQVEIQRLAATAWVAHVEGKGAEAVKMMRSLDQRHAVAVKPTPPLRSIK